MTINFLPPITQTIWDQLSSADQEKFRNIYKLLYRNSCRHCNQLKSDMSLMWTIVVPIPLPVPEGAPPVFRKIPYYVVNRRAILVMAWMSYYSFKYINEGPINGFRAASASGGPAAATTFAAAATKSGNNIGGFSRFRQAQLRARYAYADGTDPETARLYNHYMAALSALQTAQASLTAVGAVSANANPRQRAKYTLLQNTVREADAAVREAEAAYQARAATNPLPPAYALLTSLNSGVRLNDLTNPINFEMYKPQYDTDMWPFRQTAANPVIPADATQRQVLAGFFRYAQHICPQIEARLLQLQDQTGATWYSGLKTLAGMTLLGALSDNDSRTPFKKVGGYGVYMSHDLAFGAILRGDDPATYSAPPGRVSAAAPAAANNDEEESAGAAPEEMGASAAAAAASAPPSARGRRGPSPAPAAASAASASAASAAPASARGRRGTSPAPAAAAAAAAPASMPRRGPAPRRSRINPVAEALPSVTKLADKAVFRTRRGVTKPVVVETAPRRRARGRAGGGYRMYMNPRKPLKKSKKYKPSKKQSKRTTRKN
jgi:hypothetical protein